MAIDHVKSAAITLLDGPPAAAVTAGEGSPGYLKEVGGYNTAVAASSANATYQWVRVPSNCKLKAIWFFSAAQGGGTVDIGLYYATDGLGNQPTALLAANAINQNIFAAASAVTAAQAGTQVLGGTASFTMDKRNMPLWQAAGLTSDPGGSFDIVGTVVAPITTGTGLWGVSVYFCE